MEQNKNGAWWENAEDTNRDSDFFTIPTGDTKLRLLTPFVRVNQLSRGEFPNADLLGMVDDTYQPAKDEKVTVYGWSWAIVRATGELKIVKFSSSLLKALTTLKTNPEYAFDELPAYDLTIHNTGEGGNRYSITPARANTDVTVEETAELNKKKKISDIIELIKNKKAGKTDIPDNGPVEYPNESPDVKF